jgi:hypothetical protein
VRRCIFCGKRANTIEHVWPKWAIELIAHPGIKGEVAWGQGDEPLKTFPAGGESVNPQVKHLCGECNNGWMSDLENTVRLMAGAMIMDISIRMNTDAQKTIATWCFKTALVLQCTGRKWFYTETDRRHFLSSPSPPLADTIIWLARNSGEAATFFETIHLHRNAPKGSDAVGEGYVSTAALSHLAVQVFSFRRDPEYKSIPISLHMKPGPWDDCLVQVWPTSPSVNWPPDLTCDLAGLHALSARFSGR